MKLKELIKSGDYSKYETRPGDFYNYYENQFSDLLYRTEINCDHYDAVKDSGRVLMIVLREWLCTDTMVGLYLYLLDGKPCCTMYQSGRKSYPEWKFYSEDAFVELKELFDSCKPEQEKDFILMDDYMDLDVSVDKKQKSITLEDLGISPIMEFNKTSFETLRNTYILQVNKPQDISDFVLELLEEHEEFMKTLNEKDQLKAQKESAEMHEFLLELKKDIYFGMYKF